MSMFPGPGAQIYRNEAGEPLGWDYPSDPEPADFYDDRDVPFACKCGAQVWVNDVDEIVAHHEVCTTPEWLRAQFPDELASEGSCPPP